MAKSDKKASATTKASAKPPKAPAKKTASHSNGNGTSVGNGTVGNGTSVNHDQVAQLAHRYFIERGHQHGHHEDDWYRAEQELRAQVS